MPRSRGSGNREVGHFEGAAVAEDRLGLRGVSGSPRRYVWN